MREFISETYQRLIDKVDLRFKRYLYSKFEPGRLTGLIGPRGVGKTTLLLQYIKENLYANNEAFYFSADSIYFQQTTLLEYINELYQHEGYKIFFIDEIHKYQNWNQELKNLYDSFPTMKIVFSGSSMLDIIKGTYDLSRRAKIYHLPGMSFREYLNYYTQSDFSAISFEQLINNDYPYSNIITTEKLKGHFKRYLTKGYYPFVFEDEHIYFERVARIIEKTIFEDIANYYSIKTPNLHLFQKILSYLASIEPGQVNTHNIAQNMKVANQTIDHFLSILKEVGMIQMVYAYQSGNKLLRKPKKIFLHNTTLLHTLQQFVGPELSKGTLRELYFIQALRDSHTDIYYSQQADFRTIDHLFEVGGKNKTKQQLKGSDLTSFLVKDDILIPGKKVMPLIFCGFLY